MFKAAKSAPTISCLAKFLQFYCLYYMDNTVITYMENTDQLFILPGEFSPTVYTSRSIQSYCLYYLENTVLLFMLPE